MMSHRFLIAVAVLSAFAPSEKPPGVASPSMIRNILNDTSILTGFVPLPLQDREKQSQDKIDLLQIQLSKEIQSKPDQMTPERIHYFLKEAYGIIESEKSGPIHAKALHFSAFLHMMIDQTGPALEKIDTYLKQYPTDDGASVARAMKADLLLRTGNVKESIAFIQDILKQPVGDERERYELQHRLFQAYLMNENLVQASQVLEAMNQQFKDRDERWAVLVRMASIARLEEDRTEATRILADIAKNCKDPELIRHAERLLADYEHIGIPVEQFVITDARGTPFSMENQKGKVTVVLFWTARQGPDLATFSLVDQLYARNREKGVAALGICVDEERDVFDQLMKARPAEWAQTHDPDHDLVTLFHIQQVPHILLVDRKGTVRFSSLDGPELTIALNKLISEK